MYLVQVVDTAGNVVQTLLETVDFSAAMVAVGSLDYRGDRQLVIVQKTQSIEFAVVDHFDQAGRFREVWPDIDAALELATSSPAEYRVTICRMGPFDALELFCDVQQLGAALLRADEPGVLGRFGAFVSDPQASYLNRVFSKLGFEGRDQCIQMVQSIANSERDQAEPDQGKDYEAGRLAASQGCYRMVWCGSDSERNEWLRGFDSVAAGDNRS